jgi:hypothetical protein
MKINYAVCKTFKCERCEQYFGALSDVPDDCQYGILHALDDSPCPLPKPRRSGKTTTLVNRANCLVSIGKVVYFIVSTVHMGNGHGLSSRA